jgi:hypothetical protein
MQQVPLDESPTLTHYGDVGVGAGVGVGVGGGVA